MSIRIGEVIAVHGTKITLKIDEQSSKETLFYDGQKYKGVSIREYLSIQRGFRDIICMVEGEFLDESRVESTDGKITYVRKVEARPIGFFDQDGFKQGIKYMPMIKDAAYLLQEERILSIFDRGASGEEFIIGRMLKEDISINLPWKRLFNSHIGIFGNTGSGKSNTLAKLFTVLFEQKLQVIEGKSRFVILDFNGEYTGDQLAPSASKHVYALSTQYVPTGQPPADLYPLDPSEFWDLETLSLLFQATTNTQRPFLNRVIEGKKKYERNADSLTAYAKAKFRDAFCAGECKPATLDLMRSVARHVGNAQLVNLLREVNWHTKGARFFRQRAYFGTDGVDYAAHIEPTVDTLNITNLDAFDQLIVRTNLQLISDLIAGYVQFEHIQPLLKRVESALTSLRKVLTISNPVAASSCSLADLQHQDPPEYRVTYAAVPLCLAFDHKSSRSTSSLAGCLSRVRRSTWITIGKSKAVPVTTQHPCARPGMRLRESASNVVIVLSIRNRSRSFTSRWIKKLCSCETIVGEMSAGRWLAIVTNIPNFLPSLIISSNCSRR